MTAPRRRRAIRRIPTSLRDEARGIAGPFLIWGSRTIRDDELDELPLAGTGLSASSPAIEDHVPIPSLGVWARRNTQDPWVKVHRDRPRVTRSWTFDVPIFGDPARGWVSVTQSRQVFQRTTVTPPHWSLRFVLAPDEEPDTYLLTAEVEGVFVETELDADSTLIAANLVVLFTGGAHARAANVGIEAFARSLDVTWDFFPPGHREEHLQALRTSGAYASGDVDVVAERLIALDGLGPYELVIGTSGMARYFGAKFQENLVVFENLRYGNAIYVMFDDWQVLSQRSRLELLGSEENFERIPHRGRWVQRLHEVVRGHLGNA